MKFSNREGSSPERSVLVSGTPGLEGYRTSVLPRERHGNTSLVSVEGVLTPVLLSIVPSRPTYDTWTSEDLVTNQTLCTRRRLTPEPRTEPTRTGPWPGDPEPLPSKGGQGRSLCLLLLVVKEEGVSTLRVSGQRTAPFGGPSCT